MTSDHDEWLKERADELVQKTHARIGTWIEQRKAIIDFAREYAALASHTGEAEPVSAAKFIQTVPDHCDRIVWRGRYHHLPIATPTDATPVAPGEVNATIVYAQLTDDARHRTSRENIEDVLAALFHPALAQQSMEWDARHIKQPGWHHVGQAFIDGAREARANPEATEDDFKRAADGYSKRVFEEVDPESERRLRTGDFATHPAPVAAPAPASEADTRCPDCLGSEFPGWKRGFRCRTCKGSATVEVAAPTPGDSADAPVQHAGEAEPTRDDNELASDFEHRLNAWHKEHAALKGEQPEPSGSERGEV